MKRMNIILMKHKLKFFLFLLLSLLYWQWFMPGPGEAKDFPLVSQTDFTEQFDLPRVWQSRGSVGMGEFSTFTMWSWPLNFVVGAFAKIGFDFNIIERVFLFLPILIIGILAIFQISKELKFAMSASFAAGFFYLANTYIILLIDGGQLMIGLAYAWFPLSYLIIKNSVNKDFRSKVIAGFTASILGVFDIRFLLILALLLAMRFIFELAFLQTRGKAKHTLGWMTTGLTSAFVYVLLNFYWIYPFLKYPLPPDTIGMLTRSSDLSFTTVKHSALLLSPHWYKNAFGVISPARWEFLLIPILVILAPVFSILKGKGNINKEVLFWFLVAIVSVFLTKGTSTPLPGIYTWLFTNLPGFSLFRHSTKFFFLVTLSYSIL